MIRLESGCRVEQIARLIPLDFPDYPLMKICHETIYRFILKEDRSYVRCLRQGKYRNRYACPENKYFKRIRGGKHIMGRPEEVELRTRPNIGEVTLCGAHQVVLPGWPSGSGVPLSVVAWLSDPKAKAYNDAIIESFGRSGLLVKMMTVDNGMSFPCS